MIDLVKHTPFVIRYIRTGLVVADRDAVVMRLKELSS